MRPALVIPKPDRHYKKTIDQLPLIHLDGKFLNKTLENQILQHTKGLYNGHLRNGIMIQHENQSM
jgi:hypothetical protein